MQTRVSRRLLPACLLSLTLSTFLFSQNQPPQSDPKALSFAAKAMLALTAGNAINDVTLVGSATWHGRGNDETGTASLRALGGAESRIDISLSDGKQTEIRDASVGITQGWWSSPDGKSGKFAYHNTLTDAVWFFPALSALSTQQNVILQYIGQETRPEGIVEHIRSYTFDPKWPKPLRNQFADLSKMEFYLDTVTSLPVAVSFDSHPNKNANTRVPIEVRFSDYQKIDGVLIPTHVKEYLQGYLLMDITTANVTLNTGLGLSDFSVNPIQEAR